MKYFNKGLIFFASLLIGVSQASAGEWQIVGPRALGMGGANVAVANDATASYWNPGAFGFFDHPGGGDYGNRGWSSSLGAGVGAQVLGGLGEQIDKIDKIDFDSISGDTISTDKVSDLISLIDTLKAFDENKDMAANILVNSGLRIQSGHFGIGAVLFANIAATVPDVDLVNLGTGTTGGITRAEFISDISAGCSPTCSGTTLDQGEKDELSTHLSGLGWSTTEATDLINAVDASLSVPGARPLGVDEIKDATTLIDAAETASGGLIKNNTSEINFKGIAVAEIPITYGRALSEDFAIGGNVKYMKARVYNVPIKLLDDDTDDEFGDSLDTALDDYDEETNFGVDLGMLYRFGDNLRVGLVGRNMNNPKFGDFKEKTQVRAGFAYKPLSFITIAGDADLTKNDTFIKGASKSQNLGAGLEIRLFNFLMLRGGAYKNIAENDIGLVYTAGLGINLWLLNIDVGASMSKKKTDLDDESYPEEVKGAFAISMLF